MNIPTKIQGVNPIAALPFTSRGDVDYTSFGRLLEHLAGTGADGLTLFGIASEFSKLEDGERARLTTQFLSDLSGSGMYRALSITDHSTEVAVKRAQSYQKQGADALMLLPPFFLQPGPDAIRHHIFSVLDAVDIPVMVQYAPGETGLSITPEQLSEVAERYPHAVFKIECNPPVDYTRTFLQLAPQARVMNGYAGLYMLAMLEAGGKGVMPGCSFTEVYVQIYRLWQQGKGAEAAELHTKLLPYITRWMTHCEYIIQAEKSILYRRGIIACDYCRHPGWVLTDEDHTRISNFIATFAL